MAIETSGTRRYNFSDYECYDPSGGLCHHMDTACFQFLREGRANHSSNCPWTQELRTTAQPSALPWPTRHSPNAPDVERWDPAVPQDRIPEHLRMKDGGNYRCGVEEEVEGWRCTLVEEHDEDYHLAHGTDSGDLMARWPRVVPKPKATDNASLARAQLASPDYEGDHGFSGEQLDAWEHQRSSILTGLLTIAAGKPLPTDEYSDAMNAPCPASAVPETIEEEVEDDCTCSCGHEHTTFRNEEVDNPEYSGSGTTEGGAWVEAAKSVLRLASRRGY